MNTKRILSASGITFLVSLVAASSMLALCGLFVSCGGGGGTGMPPPPPATPQITWSASSIEPILSPGESTSQTATFSSNIAFQNAVVEAIGAVAQFVTISPSTITNVAAGQDQAVHLSFSVPASTALGTLNGTVQVRSGGQALSQTLQITAKVWAAFSDSSLGVSLKVPPGFASRDNPDIGFGFIGGKLFYVPGRPVLFSVDAYSNSARLSPVDWFNSVLRGNEFTGGFGSPIDGVDATSNLSISGLPALEVDGTVFSDFQRRIFVGKGDQIIEFSTTFPSDIAEPQEVNDVLGTVQIL